MVKQYKKKSVIIEALQWTGNNHREMWDFLEDKPDEAIAPIGKNFYIDFNKNPSGLVIKTAEGEHIANLGDFIIKGVKGEYYPCKPDIFEMTYTECTEDELI
jgi:hypothetical protein